LFVFANIVRIRKMPAQIGVETMVGKPATVRTALDPSGFVFLDGEYWTADSEGGEAIQSGERVVVTEVQGLRLKVRREAEGERNDAARTTS